MRNKDGKITQKRVVNDEIETPPSKKNNLSAALSFRSEIVTSTPSRGRNCNTFQDEFDTSVNSSEEIPIDQSEDMFKDISTTSQDDPPSIKNINPSLAVKPQGSLQQSRKDFLSNLGTNFVETVILGLEASLRPGVRTKIDQNVKLSPKENKSVIASVNFLINEYVGAQRPPMDICR